MNLKKEIKLLKEQIKLLKDYIKLIKQAKETRHVPYQPPIIDNNQIDINPPWNPKCNEGSRPLAVDWAQEY